MPDTPTYIPNKPPVQVDIREWTWKEWFRRVWRNLYGMQAPLKMDAISHAATSYTLQDEYAVFIDLDSYGASGFTINLPPAKNYKGKSYYIAVTGSPPASTAATSYSKQITITPFSGDTLENAWEQTFPASYGLFGPGDGIEIKSDGLLTWRIIRTYSKNTRMCIFLGDDTNMSAGLQIIPFGGYQDDSLNEWDSGTYQMVAKTSGYFHTQCHVTLKQDTGVATAFNVKLYLYQNGVAQHMWNEDTKLTYPADGQINMEINRMVWVWAGDVLEWWIDPSHDCILFGTTDGFNCWTSIYRLQKE